MTRRRFGAIVIGLLLVVAGCRDAPATSAGLRDATIREILRERVESGRNASIVVGILEDGQRRIIAYGPRDAGRDGVGEHTVFEIGSITKVFTASLLAEMVHDDEVELDDPIARHLPKSVRVPSRGGRHHPGRPLDTAFGAAEVADQHATGG